MRQVSEIVRSYKNNADIVIPRLWIGNFAASQDILFLKTNQITAIFNCTKDLPFKMESGATMYRLPVDDNLETAEIRNMSLWSYEAVQKVMIEYKKGSHILIHCAAGMQRSAALVAMFLITYYRTHFMEAAIHLKKRRPIAFLPSANFGPAIREFDESFHRDIMPKLGLLPGHIPEEF
jgi:hypothetical protein